MTQPVPDGADEIREYLAEHEVEVVQAWAPDIHGTMRGKRFPARSFVDGPLSGFHMAESVLCWTRSCQLYDDVAFSNSRTGYPDLLVVPDAATLRQVPWAPQRAVVLCHLAALNGAPIEVDPHAVLATQVKRAAELGYSSRMSMEYEFSLLEAGGQAAGSGNDCYAFGLPRIDAFLERLTVDLPKLGLSVEAAETEWGTGQLEITLEPDAALRAADQALLFKALVKDFARHQGLIATFMPKPFADQAGNGLHVNQSLWYDGHNVFDRDQAGFVGEEYLAGLVQSAGPLFVLGAPTINAYKRRAPGSFAPTTSTWSPSTRTVAMRGMFDRGPQRSRIEFRIPGADANPYLAAAGNLAAGLDGIRDSLTPPPAHEGDGYAIEEDALLLPATLEAALDAFEHQGEALGGAFLAHYSSVVRHEALEYAAVVTDWERDRYLEHG